MRKSASYLFILMTLFCSYPCFSDVAEEQAFKLQVLLLDNHTLELTWQIAPEHYLYKNQLTLIDAYNTSLLDQHVLPEGKYISDPVLGNYEVYAERLTITIPWNNTVAERELLVHYQGCVKDSFCYMPINKKITINDNNEIAVATTELQKFPDQVPTNKFVSMIQDRFLPITLIIFFFLGILLSCTPCVLPMIPIVVNLIVGPRTISSRKAFILSSSYVLGMSSCYAIAGIIVGVLGATLQAWMQQPVVLIALSILLVILALAQFDLIYISLPHFNTKLHHWGQKQLQGSVIGAFILGLISALIVSPCITPPLIGALTYISQHGNPIIGGLTLFSLGLGMGLPLIVVALLSSIILPKSGGWMNVVKSIAGLSLLGLAIWLLQRIIPVYIAVILWGILCIIAALRFKDKRAKSLKILSMLCMIVGAALIMNVVYEKIIDPNTTPTMHAIKWHNIDSTIELEQALLTAKNKQQFTVLEFYAHWCTSCKRIEASVFADPLIIKHLSKFNLLRVDLTKMTTTQKELLASLHIYGPPAILFFDSNGAEMQSIRIAGDIDAAGLLEVLEAMPS